VDVRSRFLVGNLFQPGLASLHAWETDRTVVGGICPLAGGPTLEIPCPASLRAGNLLERREAGLVNLGGPGWMELDGERTEMAPLDGVYLGRGAGKASFGSSDAAHPSQFYLLSYPAHRTCPNRIIRAADAGPVELGSREHANERVLRKYIHPGAVESCQLVMGVTSLRPGSVWNTMPPHTHERRSEVYLYFDLPNDNVVFHFMGAPGETRHLVVREYEAVLSPSWSIHAGVGTRHYSFVWGMGGENQDFADMDPVRMPDLA